MSECPVGWSTLTYSQVGQYFRSVDGQPDDVESRLRQAETEYFLGEYGYFVRASQGDFYELLSGRKSLFERRNDGRGFEHVPWISLTDLGYSFEPVLPPQSVKRVLREIGLLERKQGIDSPTAEGLQYISAQKTPEYTVLLSTYEVVVRLRECQPSERERSLANVAAKSPDRSLQTVLAIPSRCTKCNRGLVVGDEVTWYRKGPTLHCSMCVAAYERVQAADGVDD